MNDSRTLYERLGGYDVIYAFIEYVIAKLMRALSVAQGCALVLIALPFPLSVISSISKEKSST